MQITQEGRLMCFSRKFVLRRKLKLHFIKLYAPLLERVPEKFHDQYNTVLGLEILDYARRKIGYKSSYINQDLFRAIMNFYHAHKNE
jgi:hypothetical protein